MIVLSWGNFSHYTEVLFRSHFLRLLIKIFFSRRRRAEVQIPCLYKVQKSATGRRQGSKAANCPLAFSPPSFLPSAASWLTIAGSSSTGDRDCGLRTADCGCGLVTSSEAAPRHNNRCQTEHDPNTNRARPHNLLPFIMPR